jgi:hypothetical protein
MNNVNASDERTPRSGAVGYVQHVKHYLPQSTFSVKNEQEHVVCNRAIFELTRRSGHSGGIKLDDMTLGWLPSRCMNYEQLSIAQMKFQWSNRN